jgi:hypothetical protein
MPIPIEKYYRPYGCEPTLAWFTAWADKLKNSLDTAAPIRPGGFFQTPKMVHRRIQNLYPNISAGSKDV